MSLQTFQYEFIWIFIIRTNIFVKSHEDLPFGCSHCSHLPQSTICFHLSLTLISCRLSLITFFFWLEDKNVSYFSKSRQAEAWPQSILLLQLLTRKPLASLAVLPLTLLWSIPVWQFWTVKMNFLMLCLLTGCWYDKPNSARWNLTLHHSRVKYLSHLEQKLSQNCQRSQSTCMWSSVPKGDMTARGAGGTKTTCWNVEDSYVTVSHCYSWRTPASNSLFCGSNIRITCDMKVGVC